MDPDSERVSESQILLHCGEVIAAEEQNLATQLYLAILSALLNIDVLGFNSNQTL